MGLRMEELTPIEKDSRHLAIGCELRNRTSLSLGDIAISLRHYVAKNNATYSAMAEPVNKLDTPLSAKRNLGRRMREIWEELGERLRYHPFADQIYAHANNFLRETEGPEKGLEILSIMQYMSGRRASSYREAFDDLAQRSCNQHGVMLTLGR